MILGFGSSGISIDFGSEVQALFVPRVKRPVFKHHQMSLMSQLRGTSSTFRCKTDFVCAQRHYIYSICRYQSSGIKGFYWQRKPSAMLRLLSFMDYSSQVNHQAVWEWRHIQLRRAPPREYFTEVFGIGQVKQDVHAVILYPICLYPVVIAEGTYGTPIVRREESCAT